MEGARTLSAVLKQQRDALKLTAEERSSRKLPLFPFSVTGNACALRQVQKRSPPFISGGTSSRQPMKKRVERIPKSTHRLLVGYS